MLNLIQSYCYGNGSEKQKTDSPQFIKLSKDRQNEELFSKSMTSAIYYFDQLRQKSPQNKIAEIYYQDNHNLKIDENLSLVNQLDNSQLDQYVLNHQQCQQQQIYESRQEQQLIDFKFQYIFSHQFKCSIRQQEESHNNIQLKKNINEQDKGLIHKKKKRQMKIWDYQEDNLLRRNYEQYQGKWSEIAKHISGRSVSQCSQRWRRLNPQKHLVIENSFQCLLAQKVMDKIRRSLNFRTRPKVWQELGTYCKMQSLNFQNNIAFPGITGKQVRERYINKVDPDINNEPWTSNEDLIILHNYQQYGCKWSLISAKLSGRPENMVKNRFYSYIRRVYLGQKNPYQIVYDNQTQVSNSELQLIDKQMIDEEANEKIITSGQIGYINQIPIIKDEFSQEKKSKIETY